MQRDPRWHRATDSSEEWKLGWDVMWWAQWRNERGIGAPPRLPGTRLAWTPLWRRNFWTACKPITNIHPGLGDSYIVGLGGILVHAENCIFTSFRITFSSLGGTLSCWELLLYTSLFLVFGLFYPCCASRGINCFWSALLHLCVLGFWLARSLYLKNDPLVWHSGTTALVSTAAINSILKHTMETLYYPICLKHQPASQSVLMWTLSFSVSSQCLTILNRGEEFKLKYFYT